jgi:hypothetical protein
MMIKLKENEIKMLTKNYEDIKNKYSGAKRKLEASDERYKQARMVNLNIKQLICQMIMNKNK